MAVGTVVAMRIAVGSDHAGFDLKELIAEHLRKEGHDLEDLGTHDAVESVDYPLYGAAVGRAVAEGRAELGFCCCGTGIGIAIAANKIPGIRAAVVHDVTTATLARQHNHANVVCLGGRTTGTYAPSTPSTPSWPPPRCRAATTGASRSSPSLDRDLVDRQPKRRLSSPSPAGWTPTPRWRA